MDPYKGAYATDAPARTLAEALAGADVLVGLSVGNVVSGDMLRGMARDPVVFAMANPVPEISWEEARAARPDAILATGHAGAETDDLMVEEPA